MCDCSFLLAARVAIASLLYHACRNSHLPFLRRLKLAGEIDRIYLFVRALAAAFVVKVSSLPGVGPKDVWLGPVLRCSCFPPHAPFDFPAKSAGNSVTSNVLIQVPVALYLEPRFPEHASGLEAVSRSFVARGNSGFVNSGDSSLVTSNVLVQEVVPPLVAPLFASPVAHAAV